MSALRVATNLLSQEKARWDWFVFDRECTSVADVVQELLFEMRTRDGLDNWESYTYRYMYDRLLSSVDVMKYVQSCIASYAR